MSSSYVHGYGPRKVQRLQVTRALERIEDDPSSPIALSELAALSGVSRYQLVREFSRAIGTTPYAYVIQCRARLARKLLVNGVMLADAAHEAGFADQSHMTRAFVRQFGITPGYYQAACASMGVGRAASRCSV
jgi:AraC-like DNA-binding protein